MRVPLVLMLAAGCTATDPMGGGDDVLETIPDGGEATTTIRFGQRARPVAVTADAEHVYWLEWGQLDGLESYTPGALVRAPHAGGQPQVIVNDVSRPWWIASDDTHVYWTEEGRIARWAKSGGAPEVVIADVAAVELAVGGTHVAWRQLEPERGVFTAPKNGGDAIAIELTEDADIVAADATRVYWGHQGSVASAPIGGGEMQTVLSGRQPHRLVVRGDELFVGASDLGDDAIVIRVDLTGGDPVNLALQPGMNPELVVADEELFIAFASPATGDWSLVRAPLAPGPATPVASEAGDLRGIAAIPGTLYWITAGASDAATGAIHHAPL